MTEISPSINYIYCVWLKFSTQKPETNTTNKTHNQGGHLAKQLRHHLGCPHPMAECWSEFQLHYLQSNLLMARVPGSLLPTWETWEERQASNSSPAQ